MSLLRALLVLAAILCGGGAGAHALQPGYLELRPLGADRWQVIWRVPDVLGRPMPIVARLPEACSPIRPPMPSPEAGAWVSRFQTTCPGGLSGGTLEIEALDRTRTDVLVRYGLGDGSAAGPVDQTYRLTAAAPSLTLPERQGTLGIASGYFGLGMQHILYGLDHLLFVAALMLVIADRWRLLGAVTAFTLAHSVTLALAALGWLFVPMPPVDAAIALSIAFLAAEAVQRRRGGPVTWSRRAPWIVAFGFGLLHGLGFGTALVEIGLPPGAVPLALVAFNLGVEAGQVGFILVLLSAWAGLSALRHHRPLPPAAWLVPAYAIGALGMFWTFERMFGFFA